VVGADVEPADVIAHDKDDVGLLAFIPVTCVKARASANAARIIFYHLFLLILKDRFK